MFVGVGKPSLLFFVIGEQPVQFAAVGGVFKRALQKNKNIWICNGLPHIFNKGMFLCDVTTMITMFLQASDKCGFAGTARADYANQMLTIIFLHYRVEVDSIVPVHLARRSHPRYEAVFDLSDAFQIGGHDAEGLH